MKRHKNSCSHFGNIIPSPSSFTVTILHREKRKEYSLPCPFLFLVNPTELPPHELCQNLWIPAVTKCRLIKMLSATIFPNIPFHNTAWVTLRPAIVVPYSLYKSRHKSAIWHSSNIQIIRWLSENSRKQQLTKDMLFHFIESLKWVQHCFTFKTIGPPAFYGRSWHQVRV